ncbi:MAG: hypothetical protein K6G38_03905, partial [Gammaproteobacteria bacterium]|nr:hypothetical protein [Gammaproteobacteria bacterium]
KGKTSLVVQSKAIKKELEDEIKNQEIISEGLTKKYNSRKQVHDELEHLKKIQAESLEKRTINECWNTYESYLNDAKADEDKLDQLLNNYKNGYPTKDEVNELSSLLSDRSIVLSKKDDISFSEEKEERFNELSKEFKDGIPTDSELDEIDKSLEEHKRLSVLNSEEVQELSEEEKKILNKYSDKNYKEDFESITLKEAEYNSIDKKLRDTPRLLDQQNTDKPKSKLPLIMAISSIVLLGAGIGLLFVVQLVGIILLSFGGVLLLISGFLYLKGKIEASSNAPKTNAEYLMLDNNLKDKASEIHAILSKYNIYSESVLTDITVFKNEVNRFEEISTKEKSSIEKNTQNSKDLERLKKEISDFLNKYLEYESISKGLEVLKDNIKEFNRLSSERKEYLEDKETIENSLQKLNDSIKNIDDKYKLDILNGNTKLDDLRNDVSSIESLKESVINKNNRASLYKTQKNLTQKPLDEETIDYSDEIRQLDQDLLKIENEIDRDESDIDSLAENKNKLTELDAEIKKLEHKSMVLETLKDELIKAQTILDKKYVAPIMTKFNDYATKLGNALGMNIGMGRDFNILLEVNGKYKPYEHLSSGQMAICALCFRLALLDNIYNGDVPFIIMDDPFVSLDEKNIKSVQKLIQSLSNDKQILYLSCHKSRTI